MSTPTGPRTPGPGEYDRWHSGMIRRARQAAHEGRPDPAWSTGEQVIAALILGDDAWLARNGENQASALLRLSGDLAYYRYQGDAARWTAEAREAIARSLEPDDDAGLDGRIAAYLTRHGWHLVSRGTAGAMWAHPSAGRTPLALADNLTPGDFWAWRRLALAVARVDGRTVLAVTAEILDPAGGPAPEVRKVAAWQWTRIPGTDVEILTDTDGSFCVRPAAGTTTSPPPEA